MDWIKMLKLHIWIPTMVLKMLRKFGLMSFGIGIQMLNIYINEAHRSRSIKFQRFLCYLADYKKFYLCL